MGLNSTRLHLFLAKYIDYAGRFFFMTSPENKAAQSISSTPRFMLSSMCSSQESRSSFGFMAAAVREFSLS